MVVLRLESGRIGSHGHEGRSARERVEAHLIPAPAVADDRALCPEPAVDADAVGPGDPHRGLLVRRHLVGRRAVRRLVVRQHVDDDDGGIVIGRRMGHPTPVDAVVVRTRDLDRAAADDDRAFHAGVLVDVLALELRERLHLDERRARRILHHADAIPRRRITQELPFDLAREHDLRTDRRQRIQRRVAIVGLAATDLVITAVGVVGPIPVLHQVDHPHRPVLAAGRGESGGVPAIDLPVAGCVVGSVHGASAFGSWRMTRRTTAIFASAN
jgi:hypothetical protein